MCIEDDRARIVLTEDLGQTDARNDTRAQDVLEHGTRTDGRELIHIADENEMCPREDGGEEMLHEHDVHHGNLVHNDDICLELRLRVACKAHLAVLPALCFEHAVYGRSGIARRLRETLCRASRRGGKQDLKPLRPEDVDHAAHDGRLARARASCQNENTVFESSNDRLTLRCSEADTMLRLPRRNEGSGIVNVDVIRLSLQHPQQPRRLRLRLVELRCVDETLPHLVHCIETAHLHLTAEHLHDLTARDTKTLRCLLCKHGFGNAAVSARGDLCELIGKPCSNARRGVFFPSCGNGDGIRCDEADPVNLLRETIGSFLHHLDRKRPVCLENTRRVGAAHTVLLKPEHDVAQLGLAHIGGGYLLHSLRADARNFFEAARRTLDDEKCLRAELLDDAPRHRGTNPVNGARCEKTLNAARTRGSTDAHTHRLKLSPKTRVRDPAPRQTNLLPDQRSGTLRCRRAFSRVLHTQAKDSECTVARREDDMIDNACQLFFLGVKPKVLLEFHVTPPSAVPTSHNAA